jgi:hypothetical protein
MKPREILSVDPLVSDMACHTRSPFVISLSSRTAPLNEEERDYLNDCILLTSIKSTQYDAFEMIVDERSDPDKARVGSLKELGRKKLSQAVTMKKASVAGKSIAYLRSRCARLVQDDLTDLGERSISLFGVSIPLLSFYLATKMTLHAAAVDSIPLIVFLKRIKFENGVYEMDGCRVLTYDFSSTANRFVPATLAPNRAGAVFEMFSCYNKGADNDGTSFLAKPTFDGFLKEFSEQDIATLIMILAAGHCQYPTVKKEVEKQVLDTGQIENVSPVFQVDLFSASRTEYNQLTRLARCYGLFGDRTRYVVDKRRTDKTIPISVDHAYSATLEETQEKCQALEAKCKGLKEKPEIITSRGAAL